MRKVGHIALREFAATVGTKGFLIGLLLMPAVITVMAIASPRLFNQRNFRVQGQLAIVDPTGAVTSELRTAVDPATITARRQEETRRLLAAAPSAVREMAQAAPANASQGTEIVLGPVPNLTVVARPPDADVQREKEWLTQEAQDEARHLALVVIHPDAVVPANGGATYGTYDLYVPSGLDDRIENVVQQSLRDAIVAARTRAEKLDRERIDALIRVDRVRSVMVTKGAERQTVGAFNRLLPFVFAGLMVFGILIGGQSLMTSTIEEKSSRVVEVLLSAVSPMELMAGKILGQMGVSLVVLGLYLAMGIAALLSFALLGLLDPWLLFYLTIFFVIAYVVNASLMVAVGAAVNEMKEAQSLMMPIMLTLMAPWILAQPIGRDPNSTFSTVISFIPPVNTFTMLIRMTSITPPPLWQVWLSIGIGVASAFAAIWFAAKVFRIGLLMYGKPPDFATLIRWARAA
ncbi:MAG: ABC transporter permease [Acidobacteriota bacterium]